MGWFNWGREGPPDDAYSRVTEPERFAPLHGWALEAVARLQTEYEVTLDEGGDNGRRPGTLPAFQTCQSSSPRYRIPLRPSPLLSPTSPDLASG